MRTPKTPEETFVFLKSRLSEFYEDFWSTHLSAVNHKTLTLGHGPEHDLTVAKFCLMLSDNQDIRELGWAAALMHSMDRMMNPRPTKDVLSMLLGSTVDFKLRIFTSDYFTSQEKYLIKDAVLHHSERNKSEDSEVLLVLKDADRLANLAPEIIMRAGQFAPAIPSFNPLNPGLGPSGSFANLEYAMDDLYYVLEWVMGEKFWLQPKEKWLDYSRANHWFRTEKAWPIAWRYAQTILKYIEEVRCESSWLLKVM